PPDRGQGPAQAAPPQPRRQAEVLPRRPVRQVKRSRRLRSKGAAFLPQGRPKAKTPPRGAASSRRLRSKGAAFSGPFLFQLAVQRAAVDAQAACSAADVALAGAQGLLDGP